jgi:hypothetical protein
LLRLLINILKRRSGTFPERFNYAYLLKWLVNFISFFEKYFSLLKLGKCTARIAFIFVRSFVQIGQIHRSAGQLLNDG